MDLSDYAIDAHQLFKSFSGKKVVDNVTIQVPKGQIYGFLGPNGSGKTTTIRMICGLLTPDSGKGTCLGYDIRSESEKIRLHMGYMTQKFSYWEDLSIKENLEFVADMFSLQDKQSRVKESILRLGLEKRQNQLARNLSGGWKQRLALAACTLHNPQLLLLDEPTAGVDPKARREFWDEIHQLSAHGLTVLVSTHYMDEAERCHKIIYIAGGHLITQGTVREVILNAGLTTWVVRGSQLDILRRDLQNHPAVISIAPFGDSLHISGTDAEFLHQAIQPYLNQSVYHCELSLPSMEDAFIHYMTKAQLKNLL
jgi:ABC-2 type transport system ATP-binding protein